MKQNRSLAMLASAVAALGVCVVTGCDVQVGGLLADIELQLNGSVERIQTEDPRTIVLPAPIGDNADVIISVREQLVVEELPDITLLGFENLTGCMRIPERKGREDTNELLEKPS